MPASKPTPRRASGAGRPPAGGRGGSPRNAAPRDGASRGAPRRDGRDAEVRGYQGRNPRDGAERRIDRSVNSSRTDAPRARTTRPNSTEDRPIYGERPIRRFDRDEREGRDSRTNADRRPRPSSAGRPSASARRDGRPPSAARYDNAAPRRDAREGNSPQRPSSNRPSARPTGRVDDGRARAPRSTGRYDTSPTSARPRPPRDAERNDRDRRPARAEESRERRPSLPPRGGHPGARGGRDERPRRDGAGRGERRPRELTPEEIERAKADSYGRKKGWGGVARKGGANIKSTGQAMEVTPSTGRTPEGMSTWVQESRPGSPVAPTKVKPKVKYALPGDVAADVRKAFIGTSYMREKMVLTLTRAAEAYDRKRYEEALRLGRIVSDAVPGVAPVRELTGLASYRAERWNMAKIHLRAHFTITNDPEHLPLVMDCDRANHRYRAVEKTFEELEAAEPTAEVLVEGRIVMAAALADQRMYTEAIELLTRAGATKQLRNPAYRHVRLWYALADVFDRAGDTASARELFARVVIAEPDAYDAQARLGELGTIAPRKNRKRRTNPVSKKKVD